MDDNERMFTEFPFQLLKNKLQGIQVSTLSQYFHTQWSN